MKFAFDLSQFSATVQVTFSHTSSTTSTSFPTGTVTATTTTNTTTTTGTPYLAGMSTLKQQLQAHALSRRQSCSPFSASAPCSPRDLQPLRVDVGTGAPSPIMTEAWPASPYQAPSPSTRFSLDEHYEVANLAGQNATRTLVSKQVAETTERKCITHVLAHMPLCRPDNAAFFGRTFVDTAKVPCDILIPAVGGIVCNLKTTSTVPHWESGLLGTRWVVAPAAGNISTNSNPGLYTSPSPASDIQRSLAHFQPFRSTTPTLTYNTPSPPPTRPKLLFVEHLEHNPLYHLLPGMLGNLTLYQRPEDSASMASSSAATSAPLTPSNYKGNPLVPATPIPLLSNDRAPLAATLHPGQDMFIWETSMFNAAAYSGHTATQYQTKFNTNRTTAATTASSAASSSSIPLVEEFLLEIVVDAIGGGGWEVDETAVIASTPKANFGRTSPPNIGGKPHASVLHTPKARRPPLVRSRTEGDDTKEAPSSSSSTPRATNAGDAKRKTPPPSPLPISRAATSSTSSSTPCGPKPATYPLLRTNLAHYSCNIWPLADCTQGFIVLGQVEPKVDVPFPSKKAFKGLPATVVRSQLHLLIGHHVRTYYSKQRQTTSTTPTPLRQKGQRPHSRTVSSLSDMELSSPTSGQIPWECDLFSLFSSREDANMAHEMLLNIPWIRQSSNASITGAPLVMRRSLSSSSSNTSYNLSRRTCWMIHAADFQRARLSLLSTDTCTPQQQCLYYAMECGRLRLASLSIDSGLEARVVEAVVQRLVPQRVASNALDAEFNAYVRWVWKQLLLTPWNLCRAYHSIRKRTHLDSRRGRTLPVGYGFSGLPDPTSIHHSRQFADDHRKRADQQQALEKAGIMDMDAAIRLEEEALNPLTCLIVAEPRKKAGCDADLRRLTIEEVNSCLLKLKVPPSVWPKKRWKRVGLIALTCGQILKEQGELPEGYEKRFVRPETASCMEKHARNQTQMTNIHRNLVDKLLSSTQYDFRPASQRLTRDDPLAELQDRFPQLFPAPDGGLGSAEGSPKKQRTNKSVAATSTLPPAVIARLEERKDQVEYNGFHMASESTSSNLLQDLNNFNHSHSMSRFCDVSNHSFPSASSSASPTSNSWYINGLDDAEWDNLHKHHLQQHDEHQAIPALRAGSAAFMPPVMTDSSPSEAMMTSMEE